MKSLFTILLFTFITFTSSGQSKIAGIGRFKIGVTTIDSLKAIDIDHRLHEPNPYLGQEKPICPLTQLYYTDYYEVAGIGLMQLNLFFYNSVLFNITCEYTEELKDALLAKYGKPTMSTTERKPITCQYKATGRKEGGRTDLFIKRKWINGTITAYLYYSMIYNDNCQQEEVSDLTISDSRLSALAKSCERETVQKQKQAGKKLLKDF